MSDAVQNTEAKAADREAGLEGIGCSRRRTEDARFIQGKGTYVDDVKLPGMLFGDFVRSPYGHARIKSIDTSAALALPGVKDRKSVVSGKSVSVRVDLGGRRIIKKKKDNHN